MPPLLSSHPKSIKPILPLSHSKSTERPITSPHPFHDILLKHSSPIYSPLFSSTIILPYIQNDLAAVTAIHPPSLSPVCCLGRIPRAVASINQHLLNSDDVVSCCLDLGAPSMSFRINGQPVQGMFEDFNTEGFFFPVVSFSAGVK